MIERNDTGEHEPSPHSSIVFASNDAVEQAKVQLRAYTEIEEMYRGEHPKVQVGMHGPERLVGLFKTAIMTFAINHTKIHGYQKPIELTQVLEECREKTKFDIYGAEEVSYVLNPHIGNNDKPRLSYCPDFCAIGEIEELDRYVEVRAFYESLYTIQKFAHGIREDMIGGSEFVEGPNTWERVKQQLHTPAEEIGSAALRAISSRLED